MVFGWVGLRDGGMGGFKEWVDGWMAGWVGLRNGWMGGFKEWVRASHRVGGRIGIRGEYRFSSLVKLKKKEKIYAVFYFAGKSFFLYL
jgi:hypothetical protein